MNECIYAKYNRHRSPRFRIETSIRRRNGKRVVVKRALGPDAAGHIGDIAAAYSGINATILDKRIRLPGGFRHEGASVTVDYVEGRDLEMLLLEAIRKRDASGFRKIVDDYHALLNNSFKTVQNPVVNERVREVFGISRADELEGRPPYFALTMIDPVFENVLVDGDTRWIIDNEWVFDCSLPVSFVLFRSLFYFFRIHHAESDMESIVPYEPELRRLGVDAETETLYRRMDDCFQTYVFGGSRRSIYYVRYAKLRTSASAIEKTLSDQLETIRSRDELIAAIMDSRGWRFVEFVTRIVDRLFPPRTFRRRTLDRFLKPG